MSPMSAMSAVIDRVPVRALCARATHRWRVHAKVCDSAGSATLLSLLDAMNSVGDRVTMGSPTYTASYTYGGEADVPWEWLRLWGWTHGIEEDRMDMICNPVYLTNIVRCWDDGDVRTVGATIKYAGLPPSPHLEGAVDIEEPTEMAADFVWNVVVHLQLRTADEIRAFVTAPLKTGQRLELLGPEDVELLVAHGVHVVPDPRDASDTTAMVKNATACMRALSDLLERGTQNM